MIRHHFVRVIFVAISIGLCGCDRTGSVVPPANAVANETKPNLEMEITPERDLNNEIELSVDQGHQPWRLDPALAAQLWLTYGDKSKLPSRVAEQFTSMVNDTPTSIQNGSNLEQQVFWKRPDIKIVVLLHGKKTPKGAIVWEPYRAQIFLNEVKGRNSIEVNERHEDSAGELRFRK